VEPVFLVDENVEWEIVDRPRSLGHAAVHASEISPGLPDNEILKVASRAGQVLLTNDKDFGELVFRKNHPSTGVILVRLPGLPPVTKARLVAQAVQRYARQLLGAFVVTGPRTTRLRKLTV
jgi:predicted nuclease of predicted toxin-antitoxin system